MLRNALCVLLLAVAVAAASAAADIAPQPPALRLDDTAKPLGYSVDLTIIPMKETFSGKVDIDLQLNRATSLLWLNANRLTIRSARISTGARTIGSRVLSSHPDFAGFVFDHPVGPGTVKLRIVYEGMLSRRDEAGLFRQEEGGNWYLFSQFEATDARRAFPCFDEPSFKAPWQLTLHVRKENLAFSNTPVESESDEPYGMKKVIFARTKPLPSYLVALAVGPFDVVDAGKAGRNSTPVRIITPHGKAQQARWAAEVTPQIVTMLENYFDIPYPYEKLDQLAVPELGGAMENAGLITWWEQGLLAKPEDETVSWKRRYADFAAHEIAHQWFGDLVTMSWWDDAWLNESFANWMASKIADQWKPDWDLKVSRVESRSEAMVSDSLISARRIRQPIESKHDIENAFDNITYGKGEAILEMFEAWVGEEKFQKGVRSYLSKHAWGNATAGDFLEALNAEAGPSVGPAVSTFLDQSGVPLVSVELQCHEGQVPKLELSQRRYLPIGSAGSVRQLWQIPVCIRYVAGETAARACTLMTTEKAELMLAGTNGCPAWVLPNEGEAGYYRVLYHDDLLKRLLLDGGNQLTTPERVGLIGDIGALVKSGDLPAGEALVMIPGFLQDPDPHILSATVKLMQEMNDHLVPDPLRPNFAHFICVTYGEKARQVGWKPEAGEDDEIRLLRPDLLSLVTIAGEDEELVNQATGLANRWLADRTTLDHDVAAAVLQSAAHYGGRPLFERFHKEAKSTEDRNEQDDLFDAMGSFRDPAIEGAALSLILNDEFDPRDSISILWTAARNRETRDLAYAFMKTNFAALIQKLPVGTGAFLPRLGQNFCDEEHRNDVQSFFKGRVQKMTGAPRNLENTLEEIQICTSLRMAQEPSVAAFLQDFQ